MPECPYLEAGDVPVAEVLAQVLHLLELKEVDAKHLDRPDHQVVHLLVLREERLLIPLLVLHEGLDVLVEAVTGRALRRLSGQLTLLKEEGEEGEEGVLVDGPLVLLQLGLLVLSLAGGVLLETSGGGLPPLRIPWAAHLIPALHCKPPLKKRHWSMELLIWYSRWSSELHSLDKDVKGRGEQVHSVVAKAELKVLITNSYLASFSKRMPTLLKMVGSHLHFQWALRTATSGPWNGAFLPRFAQVLFRVMKERQAGRSSMRAPSLRQEPCLCLQLYSH